jgi:hypothetical protein
MPSCTGSSEAGAGKPSLTKLHERFSVTTVLLQDAGLWLLDADETAHADDLACFLFLSFYCQSRCGAGWTISRRRVQY